MCADLVAGEDFPGMAAFEALQAEVAELRGLLEEQRAQMSERYGAGRVAAAIRARARAMEGFDRHRAIHEVLLAIAEEIERSGP